ncbi:hypothetical protein HPB48_023108 [Haemaphysalis longicornis]|uniref:Uncharacterized protein n=1 Tax=Haemaphysalis longicornis TaxID=44386 RepID=A0A9J6GUF9_HAELO|nr:hypothetical protein HPB48_023108 [Haemaphysalis longicornis]
MHSVKANIGNRCLTLNSSIVAQALQVVNANFSIVGVPDHSWEGSVRRHEVHVIGVNIAINEARIQTLHITAFTTVIGVYYVQKKTREIFDYMQFLQHWVCFVSLSMAACVGLLTIADVGTETRHSQSGIPDKIMALTAALLLFSSPLATKRTAARFALAAWFLACFSLAVLLQSLLIAGLTSGLGWEADNPIEKLYPKLNSGHVIPCCLAGSAFDEIFENSGRDNKHYSVLDVMAAAAQRYEEMAGSMKTRDSVAGCMEKAARGTHVFVGFGRQHCWYNRVSWYKRGYIVEGKETLLVFPVGFAMRKDYNLRKQIDLIARRVFETGWLDALERRTFWKCSTNENFRKEPTIPNNWLLLGVLVVGCTLSLAFFCVELVVVRTAALCGV